MSQQARTGSKVHHHDADPLLRAFVLLGPVGAGLWFFTAGRTAAVALQAVVGIALVALLVAAFVPRAHRLRGVLVFASVVLALATSLVNQGLVPTVFLMASAALLLVQMVAGPRAAWISAGLTLVGLIAVALCMHAGWWFTLSPTGRGDPVLLVRSGVLHVLVSGGLAAAIMRTIRRHQQRILGNQALGGRLEHRALVHTALIRELRAREQVEQQRLAHSLSRDIGDDFRRLRTSLADLAAITTPTVLVARLGPVFEQVDATLRRVRDIAVELRRESDLPVETSPAADPLTSPVEAAPLPSPLPAPLDDDVRRRAHRVLYVSTVSGTVAVTTWIAWDTWRANRPDVFAYALLAFVALTLVVVRVASEHRRSAGVVAILFAMGLGYYSFLGLTPVTGISFFAAVVSAALAVGPRGAWTTLAATTLCFVGAAAIGALGLWTPHGADIPMRLPHHLRFITLWGFVVGGVLGATQIVSGALARAARASDDLVADLEAERRAMAVVRQRLVRAEHAERRRVAHELHDDVGQRLTAVKLNLQVAQLKGDAVAIAARVRDSQGIVDDLIERAMSLSGDLIPPELDRHGLVAALRDLVVREGRRAGLEATVDAPVALAGGLDPDVQLTGYRVVQEAVTNAIRHAGAQHVRLEISETPTHLRIAVLDDGRGFDAPGTLARLNGQGHLGLLGMRERAREIGATLTISSTAHAGTTIEMLVPRKAAA